MIPVNETPSRPFELVFGPTPIPPNSSVSIQKMPEVPNGTAFRAQKLVNKKDAADLTLFGLFVGDKPQMPNNHIPVAFFGEMVTDNELVFEPCDGKTEITIQIANRSNEERVFSMVLNGEVS